MKAYAIFDGGGVKGAALAGCLEAATSSGIHFVGYGGTSAGALIATLACIGYTGVEIAGIMENEFHPSRFLDDDGSRLRSAQAGVEQTLSILQSDSWIPTKLYKLKSLWDKYPEVAKAIMSEYGLYRGTEFKKILLRIIKAKLPQYANHADITFEDLKKAKLPPLRIVSSDITNRCAAVFGTDRNSPTAKSRNYTDSVIDAVRSSAGYPFLFVPVSASDGSRLVDGGLSSNLPSFLFSSEQAQTQFPAILFDLVSTPNTIGVFDIKQLVSQMLETALEASDHLLSRSGSNVFHIEIPIPNTIRTTNFDLTASDIKNLYNAGHTATANRLASWAKLKLAKKVGIAIQQELRALYVDPKLVQFLLWGLKTWVTANTKAIDIRVTVMLPTGRENNSRIVVYHYGFLPNDEHPEEADSTLELDEGGGCTGRCITAKRPVLCDLEKVHQDTKAWEMTAEQQRLVPKNRKAMLSVPIFAWSAERDTKTEDLPILGVLSIDSTTALAATGWSEQDGTRVLVNSDLTLAIQTCADVLAKLLKQGH